MGKMTVNEAITASFIETIEKRREQNPDMVAPWRRTWNAKDGGPRNMITGKAYRGGNVFMTLIQGYASPLWLSFKQVGKLGGLVKEEESGTPIYFWSFPNAEEREAGKHAFVKYYKVWNTEQTTGLEDRVAELLKPAEDEEPVNPIESAEELVRLYISKPEINYGGGRACYSPPMDKINMPHMADFEGAEEFYRTLFHELAHSTGHQKRLSRDGVINPISFGSHDYSEEELIAEMTASMLASHIGIASPESDANSAAYLDHWLKKLQKNPNWLIHAGGAAQKAADHIRGITWEKAKK